MENVLIKETISFLESKKLKNITAFDLVDKSDIVKYIIIATSPSEKFSKQICTEIEEYFKSKNIVPIIDGEFPGSWIILDLGEILIEILTEETRNYYNLEKLWGDLKNRVEPIKKKKN